MHIIDPASSPARDLFTSRARPSFLYVMYVVILWALPMGVLAAVAPGLAAAMVAGARGWLGAVPQALWEVFGTGYLGYTAARQWGKVKGSDR